MPLNARESDHKWVFLRAAWDSEIFGGWTFEWLTCVFFIFLLLLLYFWLFVKSVFFFKGGDIYECAYVYYTHIWIKKSWLILWLACAISFLLEGKGRDLYTYILLYSSRCFVAFEMYTYINGIKELQLIVKFFAYENLSSNVFSRPHYFNARLDITSHSLILIINQVY